MIGFIGLGDIGAPMAGRLLDVYGDLAIWNRSPDKAAGLVARGARLMPGPGAVLAECDIVGLCLTSHDAVADVAGQLFAAPVKGRRVIVDLSTGDPAQAAARAAEAAARDVGWVDAPVSGGPQAAVTGGLTIFVGGEPGDIAAAAPLLDALASRRTIVGGAGAGQKVKLCNQLIVACTMMILAEAMETGRAAGIDVAQLPTALAGGFADSKPLQIFGPRMAQRMHEPRLGAIDLMAKDLRLAMALGADAGARMPLAALCVQLYGAVTDGSADLSRLVDLFEGGHRR
ncbi:NAD(P)-dependent oxidoreductase [Niveispirillum sp. KHB5.9]|uniref:NAD(P)-dependent oxidoreductase n=1 Tax=Niveispirillum sp. KHB5.9 TaxID=3400269 RepID=UPI003A89FEF4